MSNAASGGPTSGTVTVTETVSSGLSLVSMAGSGWACAGASCTRSDALAGGSSYPSIAVTVNVASSAGSPQVNQVSVSGGNSVSANASDSTTITTGITAPTANFVSSDTTTQGNWQSKYGSDAYYIANGPQSANLGYGTFTPTASLWTWAASTTDPRALVIPGGSGSIASCWYGNPGFSFDVDLTDGNTHQIALYALDWDRAGRSERVQIVDANNPSSVLSTQTISSFTNGMYLVWAIAGHVTINVTVLGGPNAVIGGVFFQ